MATVEHWVKQRKTKEYQKLQQVTLRNSVKRVSRAITTATTLIFFLNKSKLYKSLLVSREKYKGCRINTDTEHDASINL